MKNSPVSKIVMNSTYIDYYNHTDFTHLKNLSVLSLRTCWIKEMDFSPIPKPKPIPTLTELVLSDNALVSFPKFCADNNAMFPNLTRLYMDDNFIRFMPRLGLDCMKFLHIFSISGNPLHELGENTFSRLPNLHTIFISDNSGSSFRIRDHAFNSSSLINLYLKGNAEHVHHLYVGALNSCANLEKLELSNSHLYSKSDEYFDELFATLTKLKVLNLSDTGIGSLPPVIPRIMPKLESLDVSYNYISWWTNDYFRNLTSLRILNLTSNQIATINKHSFSYETLQGLSWLDLSYNPYSCSCANLLWFARLLKIKSFAEKLHKFPNKYTCSTPSDWRGMRIIDTPISNRFCLLTPVISLIITSVSIGVLLLILAISLVYRYRWHLRYFVYILRYHHIRLQRFATEGRSYRYDIYLSCSEDDVDFILENILPRLEHELNLHVFLPQRDGIGNKIDSIIENMDASRRFILCMSDTFAVDHYCEFEASVAYERILSERRDLMIVILLEELGIVNITKTVHRILKDDDYIKWGWSEESIDLFWLKLIQHLNSSDEPRP
ncbi:toll-like receptor 3 [Patella vulgata]|uniref:toll-like receptor 3 n=1 Tax=Patella vulgata TaxID=6465 RepID=UPI0024A7FD9B|nr:toll-like receptor 3 [Patella vulgata]